MLTARSPFVILLLTVTGLYSAVFFWFGLQSALATNGLLLANGNPAGGDFVNLWTVARLILAGDAATIYQPGAFMAYQVDMLGSEIGARLWAYPPHSLFLAVPFGLLPYFLALTVWSALGLAVLGYGLWRLRWGWPMVMIGLLSPAAWQCIYFGQSGNLTAGLLLIAITAYRPRDGIAAGSAMLLTIKPQLGLLLPLVWLARRHWWLILTTGVLITIATGLSVVVFSGESWRDYAGLTLPYLSALEANGTGAFMLMIPSVFISLRVLGADGGWAFQVHLIVAVLVLMMTAWAMFRSNNRTLMVAICLIATSIITPYLHTYDMSLLLVGTLLLVRGAQGIVSRTIAQVLALLCWALPHVIFDLNAAGWPVAPLIMLASFGYVWSRAQTERSDPATT